MTVTVTVKVMATSHFNRAIFVKLFCANIGARRSSRSGRNVGLGFLSVRTSCVGKSLVADYQVFIGILMNSLRMLVHIGF